MFDVNCSPKHMLTEGAFSYLVVDLTQFSHPRYADWIFKKNILLEDQMQFDELLSQHILTSDQVQEVYELVPVCAHIIVFEKPFFFKCKEWPLGMEGEFAIKMPMKQPSRRLPSISRLHNMWLDDCVCKTDSTTGKVTVTSWKIKPNITRSDKVWLQKALIRSSCPAICKVQLDNVMNEIVLEEDVKKFFQKYLSACRLQYVNESRQIVDWSLLPCLLDNQRILVEQGLRLRASKFLPRNLQDIKYPRVIPYTWSGFVSSKYQV